MKFAENNIKDFLYTPGKYYLIPEFQRPYSWEVENIRSFIEDLELLVSNDKSHYFGTVVFVPDNKDLNANALIDGQQRVTTTLLMLVALYHIIQKDPVKSSISADEISTKYLWNSQDFVNESGRLKLRTVTTDDQILKKIYSQEPLTSTEKQNKLHYAYSCFVEYFQDKDKLERYINALQRFEIVTISLSNNDDNPQRVFESINSTGKPLTDGDKIRNYALMLNNDGDRTYVLKTYWQKIEQSLTDSNADYITDFFRTYLIAKRQATIKLDSVYPEFKKLFTSQISSDQSRDELDTFYKEIIQHLEYYLLAKFGRDENDRFDFLQSFMFKMRYVQIELYLPFALNVMAYYDSGKLDKQELIGVMATLESYFARRIICNVPQTSVDRLMAALHRDVIEQQVAQPDVSYLDIMSYILLNRTGATRFPTNQEVVTAVSNNQTYNQRKTHVNFILAAIDDTSKEAALLRQMHSKELKLSIEHIMPQKLSTGWIDMLGKDADKTHNEYLHTLANLTLTGYNTELSNRAFGEKQSMEGGFANSPLVINKYLKEVTKWTEAELKERQKWWSTQLTSIWKMPTTNYTPIASGSELSLLEVDDLQGSKVQSLYLLGEEVQVTNWASVLDVIFEKAFELDDSFYSHAIEDDLLTRFISDDESSMVHPYEIFETGYYVETNNNTNTKLTIIKRVATIMKWTAGDVRAVLSE